MVGFQVDPLSFGFKNVSKDGLIETHSNNIPSKIKEQAERQGCLEKKKKLKSWVIVLMSKGRGWVKQMKGSKQLSLGKI